MHVNKFSPRYCVSVHLLFLHAFESYQFSKARIKAYSSSMQLYINSKKVTDIKINGDDQEIPLPVKLLKQNSNNTILIKTGINQQATSYVDYDDMEFMNLLLAF